MADAIVYCDGCSRIILPSRIRDGDAIVTPEKSLCPECLRATPAHERDKLTRAFGARRRRPTASTHLTPMVAPARAGAGTGTRHRPVGHPPRSLAMIPLAFGGTGVLAGIALALVLARSGTPEAPHIPSAPPRDDTDGGEQSPAARELRIARDLMTPSLGMYSDIRAMLKSLPERFPDAPEAAEAATLLKELDANYAKLAEDALATAIATGRKRASGGDVGGAIACIRSVAVDFAGSPWLESNGAALIDAAVADLETQRAALEEKGIASTLSKARDALAAGRPGEARELLAARAKWPRRCRADAEGLIARIQEKWKTKWRRTTSIPPESSVASAPEHPLAGDLTRRVPGDAAARTRLAEVQAHTGPPPSLVLDLGGGVTMELVYIKPGVFMMGGDEDRRGQPWLGSEKPKHEVAITRGFYLGRFELTQAQYRAVTGSNPAKRKQPDKPVNNVNWGQAADFCRLMSERTKRQVRLPTEAEWEYAARAGSTAKWSWGDDADLAGDYAWTKENSGGAVQPVGRKKANAWGLYDMHGNVWEWIADWYDAGYYASSPRENPPGPETGSRHVVRGGHYNFDVAQASCAWRHMPLNLGYGTGGFRVAVSAQASGAAR